MNEVGVRKRLLIPIAVVAIGAALAWWLWRGAAPRPERSVRAVVAEDRPATTEGRVARLPAETPPTAPVAAKSEATVEDTGSTAEDGGEIRRSLLALLEAGLVDEVEARVAAVSDRALAEALDAEGARAFEGLYLRLGAAGRRLAAWLLSRSPSPDVSGFLVLQLRSEADEQVRQSLVLALQSRPDGEAGRGLVQAVASDPSAEVRCAAAHALADRVGREPDALAALIARLGGDAAIPVRAAAATALGRTASAEATSALLDALGSPVVEVRLAAAQALGGQGAIASADLLAGHEAREPDAGVRAALSESQRALRGELSIDQTGGCDPASHGEGEDAGGGHPQGRRR